MPEIKISELRPAGSELFEDSENFFHEITDDEMMVVVRGGQFSGSLVNVNVSNIQVASLVIGGVFSANANTINGNTIGNALTNVR